MNPYQRRILIFTKAPEPGQVKTRLQSHLDPVACANLHKILTTNTLSVACQSQLASVELWITPSFKHPFFKDCQRRFPINCNIQTGTNLGARMHLALKQSLTQCKSVIIIGTDCPTMSIAYLRKAFEILETGKDIVLGPAKDGGYVLLGAQRSHRDLFSDIAWGSNQVLAQTQTALNHLGWSYAIMNSLQDIDRPEDLSSLGIDIHSVSQTFSLSILNVFRLR